MDYTQALWCYNHYKIGSCVKTDECVKRTWALSMCYMAKPLLFGTCVQQLLRKAMAMH